MSVGTVATYRVMLIQRKGMHGSIHFVSHPPEDGQAVLLWTSGLVTTFLLAVHPSPAASSHVGTGIAFGLAKRPYSLTKILHRFHSQANLLKQFKTMKKLSSFWSEQKADLPQDGKVLCCIALNRSYLMLSCCQLIQLSLQFPGKSTPVCLLNDKTIGRA